MIADAIAMGFEPPELTRPKREPFKVWPECWDAVVLFLTIQTQWRDAGGLDYGVAFKVMDKMHPGVDGPEFMARLGDLQAIEFRIVELRNERAREG